MKIVQVEDYFHPEAGYQINIISKYFSKIGNDVTIITACLDKMPDTLNSFFGLDDIEKKDLEYAKKYNIKIVRLPIHAYISGRAIFKHGLVKSICNEKPDVVFLHDNDKLSSILCTLKRKKFHCPLVLDSHMLEMASHNRFSKCFRFFYRQCITPIIVRDEIPVIRIQDDDYANRCLGIPASLTPFISVGSDTMLFHPDELTRKEFRHSHGILEDEFVVLYAGKLDETKGGLFLAELAENKYDRKAKMCFVIVGKTTGEYGKQVEKLFAKSPNKIIRFDTQKYTDLPKFYQMADVAVYPKECSLSFYDAQACGLPVVFEDNEVNRSRAVYNNAICFKKGNIIDFVKKIENLAISGKETRLSMKKAAVEYVKKNFDYENISKEYLDIFENEIMHRKNTIESY